MERLHELAVPGDVEEDETLELHLLDFGRQVCAVTLGGKRRTAGGGGGGLGNRSDNTDWEKRAVAA